MSDSCARGLSARTKGLWSQRASSCHVDPQTTKPPAGCQGKGRAATFQPALSGLAAAGSRSQP
eukprot:scaffold69309_cov65-Phaeocystis_antarctica.AAC.3